MAVGLVLVLGEVAKNVFDHNHGPVHDNAEVHRAERKQVGRDAAPGQPNEGGQQREGDYQRDDSRRAHVAEKNEEHHGNQGRSFQQVFEHGLEGGVNEPGAIIVRDDLHAFREDRSIERINALFQRPQHLRRILPFAHQHDAVDNIVVVILTDDALTGHRAYGHVGDVFDQNRRAVVRSHHDAADVGSGTQQADAANEILLRALLDIIAAGVGVAPTERGEDLLHRQVVVLHFRQIGVDLVLLDQAAHADDVRHPWRHAQIAFDRPILDRAQITGRMTLSTLHTEAVNLANGRGKRRQLRLHSRRKVCALQPLDHLLPGKIVGHPVIERHHDKGKAELGMGKQADRMRHAAQRDFDRDRHLFLDFFGRVTGEKRDHLHLDV